MDLFKFLDRYGKELKCLNIYGKYGITRILTVLIYKFHLYMLVIVLTYVVVLFFNSLRTIVLSLS